MNIRSRISGLPSRSLVVRMTVLAVAMLVAYGCVLPIADHYGGTIGAAAAGLAAGLCLASAVLALMMGEVLGSPSNGMARILVPMFARTGLPLILALLIRIRAEGLVEAGFLHYLVGFYLLALAVETPMSLPRVGRSPQCPRVKLQENQEKEDRKIDG